MVKAAPKSRLWLWITLGLAGLLAVFGLITFLIVQAVRREGTDEVSWLPLMEDRTGHEPKWRKSSFKAAGPADDPDGKTFDLIRYRSPAGELAAYLTPDPKDGQKHPAIVWAHGGFGGIGSYFWEEASKRNDQSARAFRDKGIVMMMPSWRGENDNPGRFELFYGEVEDFLAAIEHVKKLPYVDPKRIYIGGHSTGGTMTLLAAAASDQFEAAFSFGGMLDGVSTLGDGEGYGNTPYNLASKRDHRLRSPMRYAAFFRRPVFYFEGGEYFDADAAKKMSTTSKGTFQGFHLPGDHFDILNPITHLLAEKIAKGGPITITEPEVRQAYQAAFANNLGAQLAKWNLSDGDLAAVLKKGAADDAIPHTEADVKAIADSVRRVTTQASFAPLSTANVATLAGLREEILDDDVLQAFDKQIPSLLVRWSKQRMTIKSPIEEKEQEHFFRILKALAESSHQEAAMFIVDLARDASFPDSGAWGGIFRAFDAEHPQTERVMKALSNDPPASFTGILLLDAANSLALDGWQGTHPYDSPKGTACLRAWLENPDAEKSSHAHSAAFGTAFIHTKDRMELVALALKHADKDVRLEGAWADVHTGGKAGLDLLTKACLQVHDSKRARDYLKELDHEKDIPKQALEPAFMAQADMSRWLQHPNELGAAPLSIEVFDHKKLHWPPTDEEQDLWLIRFTYQFKDDAMPKTGYGIVGSMTWSSFEEYKTPPTPEELYLHHATLEVERDQHRSEDAAKKDEARKKVLEALQKANPGVFDSLKP
jgi:dienelactone hydrolase